MVMEFPDFTQGFLINRVNEASKFLFHLLLETTSKLIETDDQDLISEYIDYFDKAYLHVVVSIPEYLPLDRNLYQNVLSLAAQSKKHEKESLGASLSDLLTLTK
jgi:hypothetical protein